MVFILAYHHQVLRVSVIYFFENMYKPTLCVNFKYIKLIIIPYIILNAFQIFAVMIALQVRNQVIIVLLQMEVNGVKAYEEYIIIVSLMMEIH